MGDKLVCCAAVVNDYKLFLKLDKLLFVWILIFCQNIAN